MPEQEAIQGQPAVIARSEHGVSRAQISDNALKVLYRLNHAGYAAYLVGGGVRDLQLGRQPKDFDVATDATPEQVRALFRNCRLIGRRFRLAHVHFGREIIEVATFRALHNGEDIAQDEAHRIEDGRILRDNVFGSIEEDALRRDFTVNALYYNIADFSIVDYVGGMADLERRTLRLIGDAAVRYREDPVRMLRAIRFGAKLGFELHPQTAQPILDMAPLLAHIPPARLFEEVLKLLLAGVGVESFDRLREFGLLRYLFPATDAALDRDDDGQSHVFVRLALANTDRRVAEDRPVTPAFLFAALLWPVVLEHWNTVLDDADSEAQAQQQAAAEAVAGQVQSVLIPKRFSLPMREIWNLQPRFERRTGKRAGRLLSHPRFRAAYDFLLLRAEAGEVPSELAAWWTEYQEAPLERRQEMTGAARRGGGRRRRRGGGGGSEPVD